MIMPVLWVKDVDASIAFYNKLGFTTQMVLAGPAGKNVFGIVELGENNLGISTDDNPPASKVGAGVQFMIYLPDSTKIDDHYAASIAAGLEAKNLGTAYWGDRIYDVYDPDGYWITISQTVEQANMEKVAAVVRGDMPASHTN